MSESALGQILVPLNEAVHRQHVALCHTDDVPTRQDSLACSAAFREQRVLLHVLHSVPNIGFV